MSRLSGRWLAHWSRRPAEDDTFAAGLLDLLEESVVVCRPDGRISEWNRAAERIYGWRKADVVGRHIADMFDEAPWIANAAGTDVVRKNAGGGSVTVRLQRACRPAGGWVETGLDLTAQRQAASEADAKHRHYRNVFHAMPASVWDIDFTEGRRLALARLPPGTPDVAKWFGDRPDLIRELMRATFARDVNEQASILFGPCSREELLVSIERYWPDSSLGDFADWIASLLRGESLFHRETRQSRVDGTEFEALFTASYPPGAVDDGRLVVSIVDQSEMKQVQAAVRESDAFFSDMFHGSAFAAWHLDARDAWAIFHDLQAHGVTDLRAELEVDPELVFRVMAGIKIVDVNDTALRLFEVPDRREMVGATIAPFWFPDHRLETLIGSLSDAFDGIPTFRGLGRMRTLAGNEIHVLFTRSASTALSNAGQVLLAIVDITDRVQAETALADMQANLAHAARIASLGELTASIAHEVNQPLAAITANGEAALRWLDRPTADLGKIRGLTGDMIADARRAADIVAHVRTMASPQVGHFEDLSINTLAEEALSVLGAQMDKCGVTAVRRFQAGLPPVLGDPVQLQQVIVNLVLNAAQAMKGAAGSRVTLCTSGGGEEVVLTVTDNGPGIDRENLDRLFGSFFTTKSDGMGIGLAICRTIVEAHGGSITAESPATGGARFIVSLPPSVRQTSRTEDEDSHRMPERTRVYLNV